MLDVGPCLHVRDQLVTNREPIASHPCWPVAYVEYDDGQFVGRLPPFLEVMGLIHGVFDATERSRRPTRAVT